MKASLQTTQDLPIRSHDKSNTLQVWDLEHFSRTSPVRWDIVISPKWHVLSFNESLYEDGSGCYKINQKCLWSIRWSLTGTICNINERGHTMNWNAMDWNRAMRKMKFAVNSSRQ